MTKAIQGIRKNTGRNGKVTYYAYAYADGKQLSLGSSDSEDGAIALRHAYFQEKARAGEPVPHSIGALTLRQLGELFFASEHTEEWDVDRWRARVLDMAHFADWPITQIDQNACRQWISKMAKTPIAEGRTNAGQLPTRGTLQSAITLLRGVFVWACMPDQGYLTVNPMPLKEVTIRTSTRVKPKSRRNLFDYLREDEAKLLLEADDTKIPLEKKAIFIALMIAGPRPRDVWHFEWPAVDWRAQTVRFTSSKTSTEENYDYTVHPLPRFWAILRQWWLASGRPTSGLVFPAGVNEDGTQRPYARGYDAGWQDKKERRTRTWYVDNTPDGSLSADSTRPKLATVTGEQGRHLRRLYGEKRQSKGELKVTPGWRSKLGIVRDVPLYALRHTCACQLLLGSRLFTGGRRWTREEIQSQLGHRDSRATEHYMRALGIVSMQAAEESAIALGGDQKKGLRVAALSPFTHTERATEID